MPQAGGWTKCLPFQPIIISSSFIIIIIEAKFLILSPEHRQSLYHLDCNQIHLHPHGGGKCLGRFPFWLRSCFKVMMIYLEVRGSSRSSSSVTSSSNSWCYEIFFKMNYQKVLSSRENS